MFNNVCYNWGGRTTDGGTHEGQFVGNYYKMGKSSDNKYLLTAQLEGTGSGTQAYFVSGNIRENLDGSLTYDEEGETYNYQNQKAKNLTGMYSLTNRSSSHTLPYNQLSLLTSRFFLTWAPTSRSLTSTTYVW